MVKIREKQTKKTENAKLSIEFAYRNICLAAPLLGLKPVLLFEDEAGFGRISIRVEWCKKSVNEEERYLKK